jgi:hypothetical protein
LLLSNILLRKSWWKIDIIRVENAKIEFTKLIMTRILDFRLTNMYGHGFFDFLVP